MPIRMLHVEHGATNVYTPEEAAEHEKLGWVKEEKPAQPAVQQKTETLTLRRPQGNIKPMR